MIARAINWITGGLTPVQVDGALFVCIAVFGSVQAFFSSDDAYKYVDAYWLFWIKCINGVTLAAVGALKMFRSTSYAESKNGKTEAH